MSITYTERRTVYGQLTNDSSTANLDFGDRLMNEEEKRVINSRAWDFTQRLHTTLTVANQQFYNLPVNYRKMIGQATITVGSIVYTVPMAPDRQAWDRLNSVSTTSDIPQWAYLFNNQIGFYPKPSTAGNTISLPYELQAIDMSVADFTTGTILSVAAAATTVEGTGSPTWTAGMAGKYLRINDDNSATSGDNQWYEIASVTDTDTLVLSIPYEGTAIASATQSYTIAQLSILPNGYDMLPVYKAAEQFYIKEIDAAKTDRFSKLHKELFTTLTRDRGSKTSDLVIGENVSVKNPNIYLRQ